MRWSVPNFETAADFLNNSICTMYNQDAPFVDVYDRTGKWGLITTLLLKPDQQDGISQFRNHLINWSYKGMDYETFPKDVITMKPDLSILLRNNMKSFQLEVLPKILFSRNKDRLAGALRVLSHRTFPDGEKSHKGESKENWRQVDLQADEQVMRCLRVIPESSPFLLGVETVQIRGGLRPQDTDEMLRPSHQHHHRLGKRSWMPAPTGSSSSSPTSSSSTPNIPTRNLISPSHPPPSTHISFHDGDGGARHAPPPKRGRGAGRGGRRGSRGKKN